MRVGQQEPHATISKVLNNIRAIVEVCPRNERAEEAREWRKAAEEAMDKLGV